MSTMKTARGGVRTVALTAALALALAAPASAFAAPDATDDGTVAKDSPKSSTITGTINATTLSVTVPTKVAFDIDPGADQETTLNGSVPNKYGQFTNPADYTIKNLSAVDVYGYVSKVEVSNVTLTNAKADLAKPGGKAPSPANAADIKVMVGLTSNNDVTPLNLDATNGGYPDVNAGWLTSSIGDETTTRYFAFNKANHGQMAAAKDGVVDDSRADCKGQYTMTVRGAVYKGGWAQGENFTVTPTFKVMTSDPTAS